MVPKVPEKVWQALVQSGSRKPWCKAKSGSTGFRRRFRRRLGAEPGQRRRFRRRSGRLRRRARSNSTGSGEGSGEGLGGFRAEPGQVQPGSGKV